MSAQAKNLKAICEALDHHASTCGDTVVEIRMNAHEVDRLGWDELRGIPIIPDPDMGTGRFRLICQRSKDTGLSKGREQLRELAA